MRAVDLLGHMDSGLRRNDESVITLAFLKRRYNNGSALFRGNLPAATGGLGYETFRRIGRNTLSSL